MERLLSDVATADPVLQAVLTDDATLREHNLEYRNLDAPTDVLSFSYLEGHEAYAEELRAGTRAIEDHIEDFVGEEEDLLAGQVLVSLQTLESRGPVHAVDRDGELAFMIVHGLLHVLGHDHADAEQAELMRQS
jgi:probable rRNA maturation factor